MEMTGQFVVVCWLVFLVFWAVSALSTKPTKERQPLASRLGMLAVIVLSILFINARLGGSSFTDMFCRTLWSSGFLVIRWF